MKKYEKCVLCGKATKYTRKTKIDERHFYIEGVGQLCKKCWREVNDDTDI
jgi:ribosomal protein S14